LEEGEKKDRKKEKKKGTPKTSSMASFSNLESQIDEVTKQIKEVERQIVEVEEKLKEANEKADQATDEKVQARWDKRAEALQRKEEALRKDKEALRKDKEALQKDKEALRSIELLSLEERLQKRVVISPPERTKQESRSETITGNRCFYFRFLSLLLPTFLTSLELFEALIEENQRICVEITDKKVQLKRNPTSGINKILRDELKKLEQKHESTRDEIRKRKTEIETSNPDYFRSRRGHLSEINGGRSNNLIVAELMLEERALDPRTPALSGILHFDSGPGFLDSVLKRQLGDGEEEMWKEAKEIISKFEEESRRASDSLEVVREIRAFVQQIRQQTEAEMVVALNEKVATLYGRLYQGDRKKEVRRQRNELYALRVLIDFLDFYSMSSDNQLLRSDNTERWTDSNAIVPWLDRCLKSIPSTKLDRGEKMNLASQERKSEQGAGAGTGKRTDMCLGTTHLIPNVELFVVESAASSSDQQKVIDDTYKLLRELKDMRDRIHRHYDISQDFKLYGVRTIGLEVHFYLFDKTFVDASRAVRIASVRLPNNVLEIDALLNAIGVALAIRDRIKNTMIRPDSKREQQAPREGPPTSRSEKDSSYEGDFQKKDKDQRGKGQAKEGSLGGGKGGVGGRKRLNDVEDRFVITEPTEESNGVSTVSFGKRLSDGSPVAIKRFHITSGKQSRRELRALTIAQQAKIPFVVELLAAFRPTSPEEWIRTELTVVMPRLEPLSLDGLRLSEIAKIMRELCTALKALHRFGVIHMDIKPTNLMMDPRSKQLRLIDFDLSITDCPGSFFLRSSGTKVRRLGPQNFASIPSLIHFLFFCFSFKGYIAPEVQQGGAVTSKADVFSAGMVLLRMLTFHLCASFQEATSLLSKWDSGRPKSVIVELEKRIYLDRSSDGSLASACFLVTEMILPDPEVRLSATEALVHLQQTDNDVDRVLKPKRNGQPTMTTTQLPFASKPTFPHIERLDTEKENLC
jgi:serine/threonine protein kinase/predicted  nucleic acid-binding Zn-ribbon protein